MKRYCCKLIFATALLLEGSVVVAGDQEQQYFNIESQQVSTALLKFAQQAQVAILLPSGVFTDIKANQLVGNYSLKEALGILLKGTEIEVSVVEETKQLVVRVNNKTNIDEGVTEMIAETRTKRGLLASAIAAVLSGGAGVSSAQAQQQTEADAAGVVEEIAVTGSRIQRTGMTTPTPVTVMGRDEMEALAPGSLMDGLDQLPQFLNNLTVEDAGGATWVSTGGQSVVNMRGLETQRTLVLLDGRRIVPSNHLGTVDINQFPQALIQRTEVVTGGASAAYGSDAVAGVTNFIIDKEFTGLDAHAQGGVNHIGDAKNYRASLAGGFDLGERVHLVMGGDWFRAGGIPDYSERDWFKNWGTINFGETNGVPNQTPQRIRRENVCTRNSTFGGLITHGPLAGTHFLSDGSPAPYFNGEILDGAALAGLNNRSNANPNGIITGNMMSDKIGSCDHIAYHNVVQAAQERASFLGLATIDLADDTVFSLQVIAGRNEIENERGGYSWAGTRDRITIYADNAFLDPTTRARMQQFGLTSFQMHKILPHNDPLNNAGLGGAVTTGKTISTTAALEGRFRDWRYSAYYQYGEGFRGVVVQSNRRDRTYRAMEAVFHPTTGQIVCRSTLLAPNDGCVPYNVFGQNNQSLQVAEYFNDFMWVNSDVSQHAAEFLVDGIIHRGWGAGEISLAAGASYRKEDLFQIGGDPLGSPIPVPPDGHLVTPRDANGNKLYLGLPPGIEGNNIMAFTNAPTIRGGYDVKEVFAETLVPIVRDVWAAQGIDLSFAARYANYEGSGGIWAWKGGSDWQITDELRFRLTRSRDVRAGNLNERFNATTGGGTITDPLFGDDQYTISVHVGGNPEVNPEYSDTMTYGLVYQPSWLDGLSTSFDYYDIRIKDAINQIGIANIMEECYTRDAFCDQIDRGIDGRVQVIRNVFINLDEFRTRGADIEVGYRRQIDLFGDRDEAISLRLLGSHMIESSITPYQADKIERAGLGTFPDWNVTFNATYTRGPLSVIWTERWRSSVYQDLDWVSGIHVDDNEIDAQSLTNLRISYDMDTGGGSYNIYAAVTNLLDKDPSESQGLSNIYGNIGRSYTAGIRYSF